MFIVPDEEEIDLFEDFKFSEILDILLNISTELSKAIISSLLSRAELRKNAAFFDFI